jgi:hypothetical protein
VELPEQALAMLYERTEGWAAGLRLAALSLAGHPEPGRFAAEFSGSERTVAEYLLAEVLERQSPGVRRLLFRPEALRPERARQAIELAERNGWDEEPITGIVYIVLAGTMLYQGRLAETEPWLERAERTLRIQAEPAAGLSLRYARAALEIARGRYREALAAFRAAEKSAALIMSQASVTSMRSRMLQTLVRVGETGRAEAALAELGEHAVMTPVGIAGHPLTATAALVRRGPADDTPVARGIPAARGGRVGPAGAGIRCRTGQRKNSRPRVQLKLGGHRETPSSVLPVVVRDSIAACASAACASSNSWPMTG